MTRHSFSHLATALKQKVAPPAIVLVVIVGGSAAGYALGAHRQAIAHAFALATTHQPERFSELYFNNSSRLPLFAAPHKLQRVSFHIANHEAEQTTYYYVVTITSNGTTVQLANSSVTLQNAKSADIPFTYTLATAGIKAQINVQLVGRPEHISFRSAS